MKEVGRRVAQLRGREVGRRAEMKLLMGEARGSINSPLELQYASVMLQCSCNLIISYLWLQHPPASQQGHHCKIANIIKRCRLSIFTPGRRCTMGNLNSYICKVHLLGCTTKLVVKHDHVTDSSAYSAVLKHLKCHGLIWQNWFLMKSYLRAMSSEQ